MAQGPVCSELQKWFGRRGKRGNPCRGVGHVDKMTLVFTPSREGPCGSWYVVWLPADYYDTGQLNYTTAKPMPLLLRKAADIGLAVKVVIDAIDVGGELPEPGLDPRRRLTLDACVAAGLCCDSGRAVQ